MNATGRVENSIRNSAIGIISQIINTALGLVVRMVFIRQLSEDYLGANGLFSNILTVLSLAEMGIGSAIVYNMYKPIAEKNEMQIARLMNFYKRAYNIIGFVVALCGLCVTPFLKYIIKDQPNIPHITIIYLLFLLNTVFSYFFAYKRSIFSADQRERTIYIFRLIFYAVRSALQILILLRTSDFIQYLIIQIICTLLENLSISLFADREYPFLKKYRTSALSNEETGTIIKDVKALFIYKIGSTALDGTDNIIISAFDGVISVGLLSNYSLVTSAVQLLLSQVTTSLTGSVGNYIARENEEKRENLLEKLTFLSFIIYGGSFVILTSCLTPFVSIWAGEKFALGFPIVFIHCLNIYIFGMMNAVWTFRATMGLFVYGKWRPLISAIINIVVSIFLAKRMGLLGVLLGTTITRVTTNVWYDPYIVYKCGLKKPLNKYYVQWIKYLLICCTLIFFLHEIIGRLPFTGILLLATSTVISLGIFILAICLLFRKNDFFLYYWNLAGEIVKKCSNRKLHKK